MPVEAIVNQGGRKLMGVVELCRSNIRTGRKLVIYAINFVVCSSLSGMAAVHAGAVYVVHRSLPSKQVQVSYVV